MSEVKRVLMNDENGEPVVPWVPAASTTTPGVVKVDGTTVKVKDGVLSVAADSISGGIPLFHCAFTDHILNDPSWLRADTFSWQDGTVYASAYEHLVDDIDGVAASTETISGTTITFYRAADGHKIVLPDQESNVEAIYAAARVSWYYVLDTANKRFKLPRMLPINASAASVIGTGMALGLTNGTQTFGANYAHYNTTSYGVTGSLAGYGAAVGTAQSNAAANMPANERAVGVTTDASKSGIIADLSSARTADDGVYKYLYFYVGNTVQDQTTVNVGKITETLNGKAERDLSNITKPYVIETYQNGTSWYRLWSDGWCEQGGYIERPSANTDRTVTFLKPYSNTDWGFTSSLVLYSAQASSWDIQDTACALLAKETTGFKIHQGVGSATQWQAYGYL